MRIAGVKVGKVTAVDLDGDHVQVDFRVGRSTDLGRRTSATVRIKTILGQKYLALEPGGLGRADARSRCPARRRRTTSWRRSATSRPRPARSTPSSWRPRWTRSATTFKDSPADVRAAVDGLGRLSRTIASRDQQVRQLLAHANGVTGVLAARNKELVSLLSDGDLLLQELRKRREDIHTLLVSTATLSQQLTGLVRDNREAIRPGAGRT